ncbi:polyprenyl synthetase family protein [Pseudanabaena sp. PCC 6802]|uniref:polyprenyl synthetase family protein n=1 Tax=Pseudanabaena sp. PCC 6802 TaxID=118173 RepID=UPI0003457A77|nr:polyprenyl synthetase family protein [Pseudanabaena sp. PCC 6802]
MVSTLPSLSRSIPQNWPAQGPIDLAIHDLPHNAAIEWWYINSHFTTTDGRSLSLFASFFRKIIGYDDATQEPQYGHALTWALSDTDNHRYHAVSLGDRSGPKTVLEMMDGGEKILQDPWMERTLRKMLEAGKIPAPDRMFAGEAYAASDRLELNYDGSRFLKREDGSYLLELCDPEAKIACKLVLTPTKPPTRYGNNGAIEFNKLTTFYYFIPRLDASGYIEQNGSKHAIDTGIAWYDREFGSVYRDESDRENSVAGAAWTWMSIQLDSGSDLLVSMLIDKSNNKLIDKFTILVDPKGNSRQYEDFSLSPDNLWRSQQTFNDYPTHWVLQVPAANLELQIAACFDEQEFITLIAAPAFWEGCISMRGTIDGQSVVGRGYLERKGFNTIHSIDDFFTAVGREVQKSIHNLLPDIPSNEQVRFLIANGGNHELLNDIDTNRFARNIIEPIREISDRGGKSWRSYALMACCNAVGGDFRPYMHLLGMPELIHVGSLIVDDVQDRSTVRRGGKTCHLLYGEPLAINAGTACYFLSELLLPSANLSPDIRLQLYELFFKTFRAAHTGQAFDLAGLNSEMDAVVASGDSSKLERQVLTTCWLKTAVPAGTAARAGGLIGGGSKEQIEALGQYLEALGLAFQIIDDILNLRGFERNLKFRGEDIMQGKVTLPVVKAMSRLTHADRTWLWNTLQSQPKEPAIVSACIDTIARCGALEACSDRAREMVENAWQSLDPLLKDSQTKIMLRAFGFYLLERHY